MKKAWQKIRQGLFAYSRSDRNAVIILCILIFLVVIVNIVVRNFDPEIYSETSDIKKLFDEWEMGEINKQKVDSIILFQFDPNLVSEEKLALLTIPYNIKRNIIRYRNAGGIFKTPEDMIKIYGMNDSVFQLLESYIHITPEKSSAPSTNKEPDDKVILLHNFNPNLADIEELIELGFSNYQANNLVSYRQSGGEFNQASDLLKIYGVDSAFYMNIADYIELDNASEFEETTNIDTLWIELNSADSSALVKLKGIGPSYARRILRYRELLGGYYCGEQVKEIYNFPEETYQAICNNIYADTLLVKKSRINFAEYSDLIVHPYLNQQQVSALLKYRNKNGPFKNIDELRDVEGFDAETIKKVSPYITCR